MSKSFLQFPASNLRTSQILNIDVIKIERLIFTHNKFILDRHRLVEIRNICYSSVLVELPKICPILPVEPF